MRQKIFYLQDEIKNNLYTSGSEWMLENNVEYKGSYHSYITGEVYTQPTWNPLKSEKLIEFKNIAVNNTEYVLLKPDIKTSYASIKISTPTITAKDIKKGSIIRYILQNVVSKKICEVDKEQYELYSTKKIDTNLYVGVTLKWFITGQRYFNRDINFTGIVTKTVSEKNLEQLNIASETIPNIQNYFTELEEFYADSNYIVPADINGLE